MQTSDAESFVQRVPNEILIAIFKAGLQNPTSNAPFLLALSKVCSRWRHIALAAPELWTIVQITSTHQLEVAKVFLERSRHCPIHVLLTASYDLLFKQAVVLLDPHLHRLKSLELDLDSGSNADILDELISCMAPSPLEHLRIHLSTMYTSLLGNFAPDLKIAEAFFPSLHSVNLRGVRPNFSAPFKHLSYIAMHAFAPSASQMRSLVHGSPVLTTLVLPGFTPESFHQFPGDDEDTEPITAPSLRSLAFSLRGYHLPEVCNCPLALLHAPNLEYLEVSGLLDSHKGLHGLLDRQKHTKIDVLRLEQYCAFSADAGFPSVPSLKRLELVGVQGRLEYIASGNMASSLFPFPKLSSVYFVPDTMWKEEHYTWLRDLARARADIDSPFIIETSSLPEQEQDDTLQNIAPNVVSRISPSTGLMSFHDFTSYDDTESEDGAYTDDLDYVDWGDDDEWELDMYDDEDPFEDDEGLAGVDLG
ncbi:hypothetical protein BDZ89DRAFT_193572 [Hymenopellis radicata]|nr:hypothetical protein BDZ89DRAFT_193572 [Hymenopellis radicata]